MATQSQINTNRENAKLSFGPKTEEGLESPLRGESKAQPAAVLQVEPKSTDSHPKRPNPKVPLKQFEPNLTRQTGPNTFPGPTKHFLFPLNEGGKVRVRGRRIVTVGGGTSIKC